MILIRLVCFRDFTELVSLKGVYLGGHVVVEGPQLTIVQHDGIDICLEESHLKA